MDFIYCMSKNSGLIFIVYSLHETGQNVLGTQYIDGIVNWMQNGFSLGPKLREFALAKSRERERERDEREREREKVKERELV